MPGFKRRLGDRYDGRLIRTLDSFYKMIPYIMSIRIVTDERITDGYGFASAFKLCKSLVQNPERLEHPPEKVVEDFK